jgi:hypothetical protein
MRRALYDAAANATSLAVLVTIAGALYGGRVALRAIDRRMAGR